MEDKKFSNVFSKIKLSANVKTVLRNTIVNNININQHLALAEIYLESDKILNESCLKDFEEDIFDNFSFLKEVKIYLKYILNDLTLEQKIEKIWGNIITIIKEKSPICFPIFKDATFEIEENLLNINLYKKGAFIFKSKKIDNIIENIIKDRFNINIIVKFVDIDSGIDNKEQKNNELKELIAKALENTNIESTNEKNSENIQKEINKFRRVKKLSLKIKEEIDEDINTIKNSVNDGKVIVIKGKIFGIDITETKKGKYIVKVDITDMTDSVSFKFFTNPEDFKEDYSNIIKKGNFVIVKGEIRYDKYMKELILAPMEICLTSPPEPKMDNSEEKRVELHLHTQMSKMDAVTPIKDMIKRASEWGHKAIAITDH